MTLERAGSLAILLAFALSPAVARAHGGTPRANAIVVEPGNPKHIVVRSNFGGILETRNGAAPFAFTCFERFRGNTLTRDEHPVTVLRGGTIVMPRLFDGLWISEPGLCDVTGPVPLDYEWTKEFLPPVADDPVDTATNVDGTVLYVLATNTERLPELTAKIYVSPDRGATFQGVRVALPMNAVPVAFTVSPSDPSTIYVVAVTADSTESFLLRSNDAGVTWAPEVGPSLPSGSTLADVVVSPTDAFTGFILRTTIADEETPALFMFRDGGTVLEQVYEFPAYAPAAQLGVQSAFAVSPDGAELVVGGATGGLWGAPLAALAASGASALEKISDQRVWGLTWTDEGLYAGGDDFPRDVDGAFTIGVSHDGGRTFERLLDICQLVPANCQTDAASVCSVPTAHLWTDFDAICSSQGPGPGSNDAGATPSAGGAPGDGGAQAASAADDGVKIATSCSVGSLGGSGLPLVALPGLAALALLVARRRGDSRGTREL